jgi:hypothetical protein
MFRDEPRYRVWEAIRQCDLRAFQTLLPDSVFTEVAERAGIRVVRCALCGPHLVWLAVSTALHQQLAFTQVLSLTFRVLDLAANGFPKGVNKVRRRRRRNKHDPRGTDRAALTEEAFAKARKLMPAEWWWHLLIVLCQRFEAKHRRLVCWKGFRLLALDGTTLTLPRKKQLTKHFGTSGNGKSRTTQARMILLQLPFVRLPWRYELCPIGEGERTIAGRLLTHVQRSDLVLLDQGFWSYGLFCQVQSAGAFFGIRLFAGAKLGRTVKRLGKHDRIAICHRPTGPRWRGLDLPESIPLRVIDYQIPGFRPSAVVTNVLNPRRLSREDWVHMTTTSEAGRPLDRRARLRQGLYHRRWEIETTFHELKVIQQMEASLRSHTPESLRYEVAGHVVLYLLIRWLLVETAQAASPDGDPLGLSFQHAFEALTACWNLLITAEPKHVPHIVQQLMRHIAAHQVPWRPARHEPRPNDGKVKNLGNGNYKQPHKLTSTLKQS